MIEYKEFVDHIREQAVTYLNNIYGAYTPSLDDIAHETIKYCEADNLPYDGNVYMLTFPTSEHDNIKKQYCGQTGNIRKRFRSYSRLRGSNIHMTRALKKYKGFKNVQFYYIKLPKICMDIVEIFVIEKYNLMDPKRGYNKSSGGTYGFEMSEEVVNRQRLRMIGERNPNYGKGYKISGSKNPQYGRTGKLSTFFGKKHTEIWKKNMSIRMSGENNPSFGKVGILSARYGKPCHSDTKAKISASRIGKYAGELSPTFGKKGELSPRSKAVCVNGKIYGSGRVASENEFPNNTVKYVQNFIRDNSNSTQIFWISKDFYEYCKQNNIINITKKMYALFDRM